jgi:glycosyltransferase involved in cell wall biosynthesis
MAVPTVDILIPTYCRPAALAVTLAGLCAQTYRDFRIVISDQSDGEKAASLTAGEVQTVLRVLQTQGHPVTAHRHLPRRGIAEQRQFLLDQAIAPYVLFLDDDVLLESWVLDRLLGAIQQEGCGFVGSGLIGLSFRDDRRPEQQSVEFWQGPVQPETVRSGTAAWERYKLHNAANLYHVQQQLQLTPETVRLYRVAWVAGCVLYDTAKLRQVGGFDFWRDLPPNHCGEDVLVQLRVMAEYGGCGMMPSGAYHQELPTTIPDRTIDAPHLLGGAREATGRQA